MWITNTVISAVAKRARCFYVNWPMVVQWNANRPHGTPMIFTGWYWADRTSKAEGGPFKSKSSCYRDAYYLLVENVEPPALYARARKVELDAIKARNAEIAEQAASPETATVITPKAKVA